MRSTRKSQRLRDKIAHLVTKTERKIESTSKVKKKLTKKKVAKNYYGKKKSHDTKIKKESCDKEIQESHDIEMNEELYGPCPVCEKILKSQIGLSIHIQYSTKTQTFLCTL